MGDASAPPLATASSEDESTSKRSDRSSASPTGSDKTVLALLPASTAALELQLDRGSAIFSTGLGKRAPRKLQGPPYVPVLVRSDTIQGVAMAAGVWFQKYPQQYMCVFPQAGWQIDDLWDDEDIHLETESFCRELLKFIERDNVIRAKDFAQDWSKMHPEKLNIVGGDMTDLYDKENPLSIVDKIFANSEKEKYPSVFLWHVAHMMRTAMLTVKGVNLPAKDTVSILEPSNIGVDAPIVHGALCKVDGTITLPSAPSTRANSSTQVVNPPVSAPVAQPIPVHHEGRPSMRVPSSGPTHHGSRFVETQGHMIAGAPASQVVGPNFVQSGLHVPKNRPGRSASGSYSHSIPPGPHVENMPRGPSGSYPRQHVGHMSMTQSPRLNQAHMVTSHPMVHVPHGIPPFAYDQSPIASGIIAGQPLHHGTMHANLMPHHQTQIQGPSVMHGYPRQLSGTQVPSYTAPMGDMTNMHYPPGVPPQNLDPRRPNDRRHSQQHGNGSSLYDPYEGSNPAFIGHSRAVGYSSGKKYNQNGFQNSNGRQRKASMPGSRPYHSQYTNDRPNHMQSSGYRFPGPKGHSEDDIAITQDHEHGCHINWIGPQNTTVNELFIKDLPEDIQDAELETLFHNKIGVKPKSIIVRSAILAQHNYLGRKHAFVGFSTAAVARQAIGIRDPTIRGLPVSITVPKRFFQKVVEVPMRDATEACPSFNSRYTSVANNREGRNRVSSMNEGSDTTASTAATKGDLSYSPQDARSDLHKKKKSKQPQQGPTAAGSPEARKAKPKKRRESIAKEQLPGSTQTVENDIVNEYAKSDSKAISSNAVKAALLILETEPKQSQANKDALFGDNALVTANTGSSFPTNQQQEVVSQPQRETQKDELRNFEPNVERAKQSPIKKSQEVKEAAVEHSLEGFLENEDVASDDELKNDASFHSAAESQSDLEAKVQPCTVSETTNQGTITSSPKRTEESTTKFLTHTTTILSTETAPDNYTVSAAASGIEPSNSLSTESIMSSAGSKSFGTPAASTQEVVSSTASSTVAGPAKRVGVQHTESLHPFSKISKAQAKKEREQKRKAQKREKEQAEKAKATKMSKPTAKSEPPETTESTVKSRTFVQSGIDGKPSIPGTGTSENNEIASKREPSETSQEAAEVEQAERKPASVVKPTEGAVEGRDKQGKRNGKKTGATIASTTVTVEGKDDDYGKQTGGTINNPNETVSMTKKGVKFDLPGDGLASDAQSFEREGTRDVSADTKEFNSVATVETGSSKSAKKRRKKNKAPRTWPSLEFRPRSPNPPWMGPIDMETDTQNYESIMNEACGGEDDSDFSWDDLPRNASSEESKPSSLTDEEEVGDGGEDKDEGEIANESTTTEALESKTDTDDKVFERIATRETEQAATTLASTNDSAAKPEASKSSTPLTGASHRNVAGIEARVAASENNAIHQKMASAGAQMVNEQLPQCINTQARSDAVAADSQPAKKKRANKHNKRKKQQLLQQTKAAAEASATVESAINTEALDTKKAILKANDDRIDNDDPFYDQLKGIEAIKRGDAGATNTQDTHSQHHSEISKSLADPQFMRTMEGYFKETQGSSQSKGRKVSKGDLL